MSRGDAAMAAVMAFKGKEEMGSKEKVNRFGQDNRVVTPGSGTEGRKERAEVVNVTSRRRRKTRQTFRANSVTFVIEERGKILSRE